MPLILNNSHLQHLIHLENICYDGDGDSGGGGSNVGGDVCSSALGLDQYQYWVSADTRQYRWVSVSADTYFSIGADTSSPVIRLPVSTLLHVHL